MAVGAEKLRNETARRYQKEQEAVRTVLRQQEKVKSTSVDGKVMSSTLEFFSPNSIFPLQLVQQSFCDFTEGRSLGK